ncbi:MAG: hypothetical protein WD906_07600 [Anaerolineales bacterium]
MTVSLYSLLERTAVAGSHQQRPDGSMPAGHNGPWRLVETPLRNTGNWLHLFLWAHELTGEATFRRAAERAAGYLLDPCHRPGQGAFLHLPGAPRLEANGLIGQAWTLGALFHAHRSLGWDTLLASARAVLLAHPFDARLDLWVNLGVDGKPQKVNLTLNQQVWFAQSALQDPDPSDTLARSIGRFLASLPSHTRLSPYGPIEHRIHPWILAKRFPSSALAYLRAHLTPRGVLAERSEGYLAFVLSGLGLLEVSRRGRGGPEWPLLGRAMDFTRSPQHKHALSGNRFAFGYNPTGIEMAIACTHLRPEWVPEPAEWLAEQVRRCYDFETHLMMRNSPDPNTLAGRICEAIRLPDVELELPWTRP